VADILPREHDSGGRVITSKSGEREKGRHSSCGSRKSPDTRRWNSARSPQRGFGPRKREHPHREEQWGRSSRLCGRGSRRGSEVWEGEPAPQCVSWIASSYRSQGAAATEAIQPRNSRRFINPPRQRAGEQRWRNVNPGELGGLEIYRQFTPRRPLDGSRPASIALQNRLRL